MWKTEVHFGNVFVSCNCIQVMYSTSNKNIDNVKLWQEKSPRST